MMKRFLLAGLLLGCPGTVAPHARAATNVWNGTGKWEDATKWSLGAPSLSDSVNVLATGTATNDIVTTGFPSTLIIKDLVLDSATLSMPGGRLTVLDRVAVGDCGASVTGSVTIASGTLYVTNATQTAVLDVRSGTVSVASNATLVADIVVVTNSCGHLTQTNGSVVVVGATILDPGLDADGDGLPNGWEEMYGFDPLNPSGSSGSGGDPDLDNLSNAREFALGTDPLDMQDPFRVIAIAVEGGNVRVTWQCVGMFTYRLLSSMNVTGTYGSAGTAAFPVNSPTLTITNRVEIGGATNSPARFYRVRMTPGGG